MSTSNHHKHRHVIGAFSNADQMHAAVMALETAGFTKDDLSLIANEHTIDEKLGHIYRRTEGLENDPETPRIAYTEPAPMGDAKGALIGAPMYVAAFTAAGVMIAVGGPLTATVAAIVGAGGAGAAAGGLFASLFGKEYSDKVQNRLDRGELLLIVQTETRDKENLAFRLLAEQSGSDVFTHAPVSAALP